MRHANQQLLPFQPVNRLAQWPATDAVGTRKLRLRYLATGRDVAFHNGRLNPSKHVLGEGSAVHLIKAGDFQRIQHIVDTSAIYGHNLAPKTLLVNDTKVDCRQSACRY